MCLHMRFIYQDIVFVICNGRSQIPKKGRSELQQCSVSVMVVQLFSPL